MAVTLVQKAATESAASAATVAQAFAGSVTVGNKIVVAFGNSARTITSVADNLGNTYALVANTSDNSLYLYEAPVTTGGACTVTVTYTSATTFRSIMVFEYSGLLTSSASDVSAATTTGTASGSTITSPSITTTVNGDLIFCFATDQVRTITWGAGSGYTLEQTSNGTTGFIAGEDQVQGTAGPITAALTGYTNGDGYDLIVAAFKPTVASAWSLVGGGTAGPGTATLVASRAVAVGTVAAGDAVVVAVDRDTKNAAMTGDTATDNLGNVWTRMGAVTDSSVNQGAIWFYSIVTNPGSMTVTVTYAAASAWDAVAAEAYRPPSGLATLDVRSTLTAFSSTVTNTGDNATLNSITPTADGDLILGIFAGMNAGTAWTAGTGYTADRTVSGAQVMIEHLVQSTAAAIAPVGRIDAVAHYGLASVAFKTVVASGAPQNTTAPVVTGTPTVGSQLSVTDGSWTNTPTSFTYQWTRDAANIAAATAKTYVLVAGDSPHAIGCTVTASNASGAASAASNTLAVTTAKQPTRLTMLGCGAGPQYQTPPPPPPPPTITGYAGLAAILWGQSYQNTSNKDRLSAFSVSGGNELAAGNTYPNALSLGYVALFLSTTFAAGVPYSAAAGTDMLLYTSDHVEIRSASYPNQRLTSPGNAAYQNAFIQYVGQYITSNKLDGTFVDNIIDGAGQINPVRVDTGASVGYPFYNHAGSAIINNDSDWQAAVVSFAQTALAGLVSSGYYILGNGQAHLDDTGSLTPAWVARWGPSASAIAIEYWQELPAFQNLGTPPTRSLGSLYYQHWDGWITTAEYVQNTLGKDFWAFCDANVSPQDLQTARYTRGSFFLTWNPARTHSVWAQGADLNVNSAQDMWNSAMTVDTGFPIGPRTAVGTNCWKRQGQNKTVYVNPTLSSQTLDGFVVPSMDAVFV